LGGAKAGRKKSFEILLETLYKRYLMCYYDNVPSTSTQNYIKKGITKPMKLTPNKVVQVLSPIYSAGQEVPTVMLWGQPGVGKSDAIRSLAKTLNKATGKEVEIHDVRLLLFNPVDLRGIPVPDADREFAKWLKPSIFNMDSSDKKINILFLDEITAAPPTVQASAYQLTLDRKVGEHKLPDNCIVICAGNRVQDKGVAYKMPTPLANRMTHFEIVCELEDWKDWAIPAGVHPLVIGFLNFRETLLNKFDPSSDDTAFPTPRSWEFVSKYLHICNGDVDKAYPLISGTIGEGTAVEFKAFSKVYGNLPNIEDILNGKPVNFDAGKPDIVCALSSALVSKATKATDVQLQNLLKFITEGGISKEFSVLTVKDLLRLDNVKIRLISIPEWNKWSATHKQFIF
jgi:hypothetical protein